MIQFPVPAHPSEGYRRELPHVQDGTAERKRRHDRVHSVAAGLRPEKDSEERPRQETGESEFEGVPDRWHLYRVAG